MDARKKKKGAEVNNLVRLLQIVVGFWVAEYCWSRRKTAMNHSIVLHHPSLKQWWPETQYGLPLEEETPLRPAGVALAAEVPPKWVASDSRWGGGDAATLLARSRYNH